MFGVPTMVFNGELFWGGDRIDMLIERIRNPASAAAACLRKLRRSILDPPSQIQLRALRMAHAGLSACDALQKFYWN